MNGIETTHTTVFSILNTSRLICSTAELEKEMGQRVFFMNIAPLSLLSIVHFQLNGDWRAFAQRNIVKALLAWQLKGHFYFSGTFVYQLIF